MAASNTFEKIAIIFIKTLNAIQKWRKMRQYPFCDRTWVNFDIQLNAEISIWMQSRFDGFDFSATLFFYLLYPKPQKTVAAHIGQVHMG